MLSRNLAMGIAKKKKRQNQQDSFDNQSLSQQAIRSGQNPGSSPT